MSDAWLGLGESTTAEQKDGVAVAEVVHLLELDRSTAEAFLQHEHEASDAVGMRQGGVERYTEDYRGFWDEVGGLFEGSFSEDDVAFLAEEGGYEAVRHFRAQLNAAGQASQGLYLLVANAMAYK